MSTRNIKVLSTVGTSGITIETNVTTLGDLKPVLDQYNVQHDGMKMMVGETRNELNQNDAVLPTTDFKLYLTPAKTKSGGSAEAAKYRALAKTYLELAELEESKGNLQSPVKPIDPDEEDFNSVLETWN